MRRMTARIAPRALALLYAMLPAQGRAQAPPAAPIQPEAPAQAAGADRLPGIADQQVARERMQTLLARWEHESAVTKTLDAQFNRTDTAVGWGTTHYSGRAILKAPNLAFLDFQRYDTEKKAYVRHEQIRCTGDEVYHYKNATNQIFIYPLDPDQKQRALEEGPLPFLFNFRAQEAQRRYEMTLLQETVTHYLIRIKPREEIDREAFIQADIQLDKLKFLPEALLLVAPNGKDIQLYRFNVKGAFIKANVRVNDANFQAQLLKGWDVVRNPDPDGRPQAAANVAAPAGRPPANGALPAGRPAALRPGQVVPRR